MTAIGLLVLRLAIARPARPARRGDEPARALDRLRDRRRPRADRDPRLPRGVDRGRLAALVLRRRRARAALADDGVRARLRRPRALLRALLRRGRGSRSGSTGPSASSRSIAELLAGIGALARRGGRARSSPAPSGHAGADRAARPRGAARLAPPRLRLALARRPGRPARPLAQPARRDGASPASPSCVPRFSNVAFVSVLVLLGSGIWRVGAAPADPLGALDDLLRRGDPRQGGAPARGDAARVGQPPAHEAAPRRGAESRPELGAPRLAPPARLRRGAARRRRGLRRRGPLEPRAAAERPSPRRARRSPRSARARSPRRCTRTATRCRCSSTRTRRPRRTTSRSRSRRTASRSRGADVTVTFAMLDMEMANQEYQLDRDRARRLLAPGPGARDGRPLGALVQRHPEGRAAVHRPRRRPRRRMTRTRRTRR